MGLFDGAKTFLTPKLPKHKLVAMHFSQKFSAYTRPELHLGVYESGFWDFAKVEILYENGFNFAKFRVIFHKNRFF